MIDKEVQVGPAALRNVEEKTAYAPPSRGEREWRKVKMVRSIALIPEWTRNQLSVWQGANECIRPIKEALLLGVKPSVDECAGFSYVSN